MLQRFLKSVSVILFMVLAGCGTTIKVSPEIPGTFRDDFKLEGAVDYEGNTAYLPRVVQNNEQSDLILRYLYEVGYGKDSIPTFVELFNPLTMIGAPVGSDSMFVVGELTVMKGDETLKSYSSLCVIDKTRNLFYEGDTFSELRKKALLQVRDNIELQVCNDEEFLSAAMAH